MLLRDWARSYVDCWALSGRWVQDVGCWSLDAGFRGFEASVLGAVCWELGARVLGLSVAECWAP